jgi:hypothetical protein
MSALTLPGVLPVFLERIPAARTPRMRNATNSSASALVMPLVDELGNASEEGEEGGDAGGALDDPATTGAAVFFVGL